MLRLNGLQVESFNIYFIVCQKKRLKWLILVLNNFMFKLKGVGWSLWVGWV